MSTAFIDSATVREQAPAQSRRSTAPSEAEQSESTPEALRVGFAAGFPELCAAFQLVQERYVDSGYMDPHNSGMRYSIYNLLPTARTLVAVRDQEVVGTASVVLDSAAGLPSDEIFMAEFDRLRAAGRVLAEAGMFACDSAADGTSGIVNMRLISAGFPWAMGMGIDDLCLVVNPKHLSFYQRVLGFERLSDAKSCAYVKEAPGILLHLDFRGLRQGGKAPTSRLAKILRAPPGPIECEYRLSAEDAILLLLERPEILSSALPAQRKMLMDLYSRDAEKLRRAPEAPCLIGTDGE
jgi:hypothetical protein